MTTYKSRKAWTSTRAAGAALASGPILGVSVHWPGTTTRAYGVESESTIANRLRSWRDWHIRGRGWSDIGYNIAIDQAGRVWMLRSTSWAGNRSGAHSASGSNPGANRQYVGVLLILGANEQPSAAMIEAFRHWRHTHFLPGHGGGKTDLRGHGQVRGAQTSCPGGRARALIADGTLARKPGGSTPNPPKQPDPPKQEDPMATPSQNWNHREAPESSVKSSFPGIRKDGFRMKTWVQYAYTWARRVHDLLSSKTFADRIGVAVSNTVNSRTGRSLTNTVRNILETLTKPIESPVNPGVMRTVRQMIRDTLRHAYGGAPSVHAKLDALLEMQARQSGVAKADLERTLNEDISNRMRAAAAEESPDDATYEDSDPSDTPAEMPSLPEPPAELDEPEPAEDEG